MFLHQSAAVSLDMLTCLENMLTCLRMISRVIKEHVRVAALGGYDHTEAPYNSFRYGNTLTVCKQRETSLPLDSLLHSLCLRNLSTLSKRVDSTINISP